MRTQSRIIFTGLVLGLLVMVIPAWGATSIQVQYPYDIDNFPYDWISAPTTMAARGPEDIDWNGDGLYTSTTSTRFKYIRLGGTDGYCKMADGTDQYVFGFINLTGMPEDTILAEGLNHANIPAPTIVMNEGDEVYLNLSNLGMLLRPDLFDPHTVHFHGFPNASTVFDGEPMASFGIRPHSTVTYYYHPVDPGTYMYHCHQEATEHMEMGMLGNLAVRPAQNGTSIEYPAGSGKSYNQFAYNDVDGRTGYDVEAMIKYSDMDPIFHRRDEIFQPPRFAEFEARYFLLNGRGYPDTIVPTEITNSTNGYAAQKMNSIITVNSPAQRTLLIRLINLSVQHFASVEAPGLTMKVAAKCARLLRGPNPLDGTGPGAGNDTSYYVTSALVGPGETIDLIIDTDGVALGTYYLFSRNLDQLNNDLMDRGGAMTEIVIN